MGELEEIIAFNSSGIEAREVYVKGEKNLVTALSPVIVSHLMRSRT